MGVAARKAKKETPEGNGLLVGPSRHSPSLHGRKSG